MKTNLFRCLKNKTKTIFKVSNTYKTTFDSCQFRSFYSYIVDVKILWFLSLFNSLFKNKVNLNYFLNSISVLEKHPQQKQFINLKINIKLFTLFCKISTTFVLALLLVKSSTWTKFVYVKLKEKSKLIRFFGPK